MATLHRCIINMAALLLILSASGLLLACGATLQAGPATSTSVISTSTSGVAPTLAVPIQPPAPPTTASMGTPSAEVTTAIQHTLNLYARAYNEHQEELLDQAVDQENAPFRRFMHSRFQGSRSVAQGAEARRYSVLTILKTLPHAFVLARVVRADGQVSDVTFRSVGSRWVMSEPTEAQLGPRQQIESEHFTVETYPWIADITPTIVQLMEQARANVLQRLGKVPDTRALVHLKPIFGLGSPVGADRLASYIRDPHDPRIEVFVPGSYPFGFYDGATGWEASLEATLTHEYTHLAMDLSFVPLAHVSGWMREGLAEYIAGTQHRDTLQEMVHSGQIIPIIDADAPVLQKQDLQHFEALEADAEQTYALATALVAYIVERYGGLEGFWKLTRAYDTTQDLDKALQQAFGITYE